MFIWIGIKSDWIRIKTEYSGGIVESIGIADGVESQINQWNQWGESSMIKDWYPDKVKSRWKMRSGWETGSSAWVCAGSKGGKQQVG